MRIPIAKEGYIFIFPLLLGSVFLWAFSLTMLASLLTLLLVFVTYFFRDPERKIPEEKNAVLSPADGKVIEIVSEDDPFLSKSFKRISIFLNVFNVHVNRAPIAGKVEKVRYNPGKFLAAFNNKASLDNEQTAVLFQCGSNCVLVKQIAGLIARRIICWAHEGETYSLGQRFGIIRFGSRVDVFVPKHTRLKVSHGDRVAGGISILGYFEKKTDEIT